MPIYIASPTIGSPHAMRNELSFSSGVELDGSSQYDDGCLLSCPSRDAMRQLDAALIEQERHEKEAE
jgi:hypothetical protein